MDDLVDVSLTDAGDGNYTLVSNYALNENLIIESNETLFINADIKFDIPANVYVYNKGIVFLTGTTQTQTTINNYGIFINENLIKSSNQYEYFYNKSGGSFYNLNPNQGDAITNELYSFSGASGSVIFDVKSTLNLGRYNNNYGAYTGGYTGGIPEGAPIVGYAVDEVAQGTTWTDARATSDGHETITVSGTVDTNTPGTYTITYTATDASGNVGTATRTVTVNPDTTAPVITVTSGTDAVAQGATWTDAGATADGGETVTVSGTVDTNTVGIYTITYTATDPAGNVGTATRTVTVRALAIDDSHKGGIIFYLNGSGGGLVAAPDDEATTLSWRAAVAACSGKSIDIYDDWRLPSKDELTRLYINRSKIGGFANSYYWSSKESGNYDAWQQLFFIDAYQISIDPKSGSNRVRAVRAF